MVPEHSCNQEVARMNEVVVGQGTVVAVVVVAVGAAAVHAVEERADLEAVGRWRGRNVFGPRLGAVAAAAAA
jgi:hypothetical protein